MKKKKGIIAAAGLIVLLLVLSFGTLKSSDVKDFPVPITARVEEVHSQESVEYSFRGINHLYLMHVRLFGWKQVDRMGAQVTFEKNGERVNVITYQNGFMITDGSDE